MKNPLKVLDTNLKGRDFVIGDLHGCFSAFENLLKNLNFDYENDRIISVGDLVDRGHDSLTCLSLIREPWFHSVLANHEYMMLDRFFGKGHGGTEWFMNGGEWGMEAYNDYVSTYIRQNGRTPSDRSMEIIDLLPLVEDLPYLITVKNKAGKKFHIIHAEFISDGITDEILEDPVNVFRIAEVPQYEGPSALWARFTFKPFNYENLQNTKKVQRIVDRMRENLIYNDKLSHIISGHTILQRPMTIVGQTNIDTCVFESYPFPGIPYGPGPRPARDWAALTCVELDSWKFFQATQYTFKEVEPLVVN